jgi:hypothetical protein
MSQLLGETIMLKLPHDLLLAIPEILPHYAFNPSSGFLRNDTATLSQITSKSYHEHHTNNYTSAGGFIFTCYNLGAFGSASRREIRAICSHSAKIDQPGSSRLYSPFTDAKLSDMLILL